MKIKKFDESKLENAILKLFEQNQYTKINGENFPKPDEEFLLLDDLKYFLKKKYLKFKITDNEIDLIILRLKSFDKNDIYNSNKKFHNLLIEGFSIKRENDKKENLYVNLIDFDNVSANNFKIINQLKFNEYHLRKPDSIIYINGLPLVVLEFKSAIRENTTIYDAYTQITVRYKRDIPSLFVYNIFCVISDGVNNKAGSFFSSYEFYYSWMAVDKVKQASNSGIDSLFTLVNGLFNKERLLDVIKNFVYFPDNSKEEEKIFCRYPQYYASNELYKNILKNIKPKGNGKGGTYFGATGCGKSFIILFLSRILMRSQILKNPTILIISDRTDLDGQISKKFVNSKNFIGDHNIKSVLNRKYLKENLKNINSGGVYLTTIQKFFEDTNLLSKRNNIICISDEAHRTQVNLNQKVKITKKGVIKSYGFAKYLRDSLPNATYVGFTGTPVDKTIDVFGNIADAYTMHSSVIDKITVPIAYEGRQSKGISDSKKISEIDKYYEQCSIDGANELQVEESKKAASKMEKILSDSERLFKISKDFVEHYEKRLNEGSSSYGKAMFVCSSRQTAFDIYKNIIKLRPDWRKKISSKKNLDKKMYSPIEKINLVITRNKDDKKELHKLAGNKKYRETLERHFKNINTNFKIAIVVDMWTTGFDVPDLDTIYIDKPIKLHNLIQTISRVNRKFGIKESGLIVDYIGIKKQMNIALSKYSSLDRNVFQDIKFAKKIFDKEINFLEKVFEDFDSHDYFKGNSLNQLRCLNKASEFILRDEVIKNNFINSVKKMKSAYDLIISSFEFSDDISNIVYFYLAIRSILFKITNENSPDITQMNKKVSQLINDAISFNNVDELFSNKKNNQIENIFSDNHLEKINKIKLPNTKLSILKVLVSKKITQYKKINTVKSHEFSEKFNKLMEKYNDRREQNILVGSVITDFSNEIIKLYEEMKNDQNSAKSLGADLIEKSFFDILKSLTTKYDFDYPDNKILELSKKIKSIIQEMTKYPDWNIRENIKSEIKVKLILLLAEYKFPPVTHDEAFHNIIDQTLQRKAS